jgi:8-oxo-dGTP pyrophosphatase MutT (NUDIX family)
MAKPAAGKPKRRAAARGGHPPRLQVAALCWRRADTGLRVLLITSRDTGRWIIPKGWPMRNRTEAEAAAREAWEEAGLRGEIGDRSIGLYTYRKVLRPGVSVPCVVRIYALEVRETQKKFPEIGQRKVRWFAPDKAAGKVLEPDLAAIIRDFVPDTEVAASDPELPPNPQPSPEATR